MISITDIRPAADVLESEYIRLLGFPPGWQLEGRARELADWVRDWYRTYGRPWIRAEQASSLEVRTDSIQLDGVSFTGAGLRQTLEQAGAHAAILAAASAGPEL